MCQLVVLGNQIMGTVSNGTAPFGIIDEIRTKAFSNVSWNEVVLISNVPSTTSGSKIISTVDVKYELKKPNIIASSFTSTLDVILNANNGVITVPAGSELNFDITGSGIPNGFRAIVNYSYFIANVPGDDSTAGSGRMTVWFQRMIVETTMFETNVSYPVNANLYSSEDGMFTVRKPYQNSASIGLVMAPPSPMNSSLQLLWL